METRELHHHLEYAREKHQKLIGLTTALVAVLLSGATMLGNRIHAEEGKLETRTTDEWSFYASKHSGAHSLSADVEQAQLSGRIAGVLASHLKLPEKEKQRVEEEIESASQGQAQRFRATAEREDRDSEEFRRNAEQLERRADSLSRSGDLYLLAELSLQISVVLCSISLLADSRLFWKVSFVSSAAGIALIVCGLALHPA
jgi:hypothetical protein